MEIMENFGIRKCSIYLLLFVCWTRISQAQDKPKPIVNASLVGQVIDAQTKVPIEGVTIQLEAVTHHVKTDRDGNFQFVTGQKLPFTLHLSHVGYESKVLAAEHSPITIELSPLDELLEEVVVTGVSQGVS